MRLVIAICIYVFVLIAALAFVRGAGTAPKRGRK